MIRVVWCCGTEIKVTNISVTEKDLEKFFGRRMVLVRDGLPVHNHSDQGEGLLRKSLPNWYETAKSYENWDDAKDIFDNFDKDREIFMAFVGWTRVKNPSEKVKAMIAAFEKNQSRIEYKFMGNKLVFFQGCKPPHDVSRI